MKSFGKDIAKKVCKAAESNPHKLVALFREFGADVVNVKVKVILIPNRSGVLKFIH